MPLTKSIGELLHRRHGSPRRAHARPGPDRFGLDSMLAGGFTAGTLGPEDEARLADEVAQLLPHGADMVTKARETLTTIVDHLGGQRELMAWLDRHPGRPRLIARMYVLMGQLDRYSDEGAVLDALRASRAQDPYPGGLRDYLPPDTTDETLGTVAARIEDLLADGREEEAVRLALATTSWLRHVAESADDPLPVVREMGELMAHVHEDVGEAARRS
ncbi:hypothetical protein ACIHCM_00180 [Streptomyces sp. NPDC052023]|uniref:hypothetical protein n=1 Tax=Streptomyces sp. NPDC052023 TaxID=3365681 RepID=UPI0037CFA0DB